MTRLCERDCSARSWSPGVVEHELGEFEAWIFDSGFEPGDGNPEPWRVLAQRAHGWHRSPGFDAADVGLADAGRSELALRDPQLLAARP